MSYTNGDGAYGGGPSYSYGGGDSNNSYGAYFGGAGSSKSTVIGDDKNGLRRRGGGFNSYNGGEYRSDYDGQQSDNNGKDKKRVSVQRLDFLFPKVEKEFTVQTQSGGIATIVAYGLIVILLIAEVVSYFQQNRMEFSTTVVDTSLGKRMRVNMNITFPSLACDDLHLDVIDVAGDSQINIEDTLKKRKLHGATGRWYSKDEIEVETNNHRKQQEKRDELLKKDIPDDYCGPCYGAHEQEGQCCQTCDDIIAAYTKKRWKADMLKYTAEQCVREGRDKAEPRKMIKGQGCNLSGYLTVNRVSGNLHIAMGEGIERDGRHIHSYVPEDAPNFNASHIIHQLSFGPEVGKEPLAGMTKIVTEQTGTTGLFQYFIKIVPTTYVGESAKLFQANGVLPSSSEDPEGTVETNRYFYTERFMPLMTDFLDEVSLDTNNRAAVHAGHTGGHHAQEHHWQQNAVLPGVFFIYEIYPFAVEIRRNFVPFTHLLIRCMATVGGVFTLAKWLDTMLYERTSGRRPRPSLSQ